MICKRIEIQHIKNLTSVSNIVSVPKYCLFVVRGEVVMVVVNVMVVMAMAVTAALHLVE